MRSFFAALRTLTFPYGVTSGERIVINATSGVISFYNASDNQVIRMDIDDNVGIQSIGTDVTVELTLGQLTIFTNAVPDFQFAEYRIDMQIYGSPNGNNFGTFAFGGDAGEYFYTDVPILAVDTNDDPETWHALTLVNLWTATAGLTPAYRMLPTGMVQLRGAVQGGTAVSGTTIATLPVGYRPPAGADEYYTVAMPNNNTNQGTIDVLADGRIRCISSPGVSSLSLAGITFPGPNLS